MREMGDGGGQAPDWTKSSDATVRQARRNLEAQATKLALEWFANSTLARDRSAMAELCLPAQ